METRNDRLKKTEEMMRLQESLNVKTNGENWKAGTARNGKPINWYRAIYMELAEFVDSFPWKHWKDNEEMDRENAETELVDTWHFVLSLALSKGFSAEEIGNRYFSYEEFVGDEDAGIRKERMLDPLFVAESLIALCASNSTHLRDRGASNVGDRMPVSMIVTLFGYLTKSFGMDFEDLYSIYTTKNVLNKFRNDMGYADGTYRKIWAGKEDNEWAREFARKTRTPEELYDALKKFYIEGVEKGD